jgi:hypothetical protein
MAPRSVVVLRIITGLLIACWLTPVLTAGLAGLGLPIVAAAGLALFVGGASTVFAVWQRRGADWILGELLSGSRIWLA